MKAAVLHVNSASPLSRSPTMRIASFVADELGIPLICDTTSAYKYRKTRFDVLFVKHGMLKFSQHRDIALELFNRAGCIIDMENDYTFKPDTRMCGGNRLGSYFQWSTVEGRHKYVNWNVLTWLPLRAWFKPAPLPAPTKRGLLYYGAHRPDRVPYFERYFANTRYSVAISTYRGQRAFTETCGRDSMHFIPPIRNPYAITQYEATVYIEDKTSHKLYTSPANRFYECVQLGLTQLIDVNAVATLEEAGLTVPLACQVDSQRGVAEALTRVGKLQAQQRILWFKNYAIPLRAQLHAAVRTSFRNPFLRR